MFFKKISDIYAKNNNCKSFIDSFNFISKLNTFFLEEKVGLSFSLEEFLLVLQSKCCHKNNFLDYLKKRLKERSFNHKDLEDFNSVKEPLNLISQIYDYCSEDESGTPCSFSNVDFICHKLDFLINSAECYLLNSYENEKSLKDQETLCRLYLSRYLYLTDEEKK